MTSVRDSFSMLSPEERERLDLLLQNERDSFDTFPLSFAQQRLWFLSQLDSDSPLYNMPASLRLRGTLNVTALKQSLNDIVQRHEALRTTFTLEAGQPVQVIAPIRLVPFQLIDLRDWPAEEREAEARRLATAEARQPFNLEQGPLLRVTLLRLADQDYILLLTMHHIVADGWSLGILVQELMAGYTAHQQGNAALLPELPIQYADFAAWQHEWVQDELFAIQMAYWQQQLSGDLPNIELPSDRPRPPLQTFNGAHMPLLIPPDLAAALKELGQREGATLFMLLLAAFNVLLYRYTGQTDVVVGSAIANRNREEIEGLIGCFVNTLVLRNNVAGDPSFRGLLERVRETVLGAYEHQDFPFEKLVEVLRPERSLSHSPLFQTMLVLDNAPLPELQLPGLSISPFVVESGVSRFDLTLSLSESEQGIKGTLEYNSDLFDATTMQQLLGHFTTLLAGIVANPDQPISRLPLLSPAEREQILGDWTATTQPFPADLCFHQLFEAQAARQPDAPALSFVETTLSYTELNERANQLAHALRARGVQRGALVGICMPRSCEMIISILAVLKAGAAFLPIDPSHPAERIRLMLEDAQPQLLLSSAEQLYIVPHVCVSLAEWAAFAQEATHNPNSGVTPADWAYVIYTSGSTGRPKGVILGHQGLCNLIAGQIPLLEIGPGSRMLQFATCTFDVSVWELAVALASGATLCLMPQAVFELPESVPQFMREQRISIVLLPPSLLAVLPPSDLPDLRVLAAAGERCTREIVQRWAVGRRFINAYGPTEITVLAAVSECSSSDPLAPTIGRALPNYQLYILDESFQPVPVGVPGELYIGGVGVAQGYLQRPELTAERFVPNPFAKPPTEATTDWQGNWSSRLYKTGDLVRWRADGTIEFLGRIDHQVKVRGFRIELGEIESTLRQHPAVREAVVLAREDQPGDLRLVAYLVVGEEHMAGADHTKDQFQSALRTFLKERLPDYMIPTAFVPLEALPLTSSGKVDRKALPAPTTDARASDAAFVGPRTPIEDVVASIWANVLRRPRVGVYDNFFDLGGHSLLAVQLMSRLRETLQVDLPLRSLFETPTVAGLAERISATRPSVLAPTLVPVARDGALPLSFGQERLWFLHQMEPHSPVYNMAYGVQLRGVLDIAALEQSLNEVVRRHEALRSTFPAQEGRPVQLIHPPFALELTFIDLSASPAELRPTELQRLMDAEARHPFDLAQGPLLRATLLRCAADEHVLCLAMHHIITDAWSVNLLIRELMHFYTVFSRGEGELPPDLPIQYADFAAAQRAWLQGEIVGQQLAYWRQQLANIPALELPTDRPRPALQTYRGAVYPVQLPPALSLALKDLSRREHVTLFMTLVAAFQTLLYRYSGQDDIGIGTPIANRQHPALESVVGFFINMLVLRSNFADNPSFRALLARVRDVALNAYAHQDIPFERLVQELQPERDLSRSPLFQVMFVLQHTPSLAEQLPDLHMQLITSPTSTAKFDLTLSLIDTDAGLSGEIEYNVDLFDAASIARLADNFQTLLTSIVADPDQRVAALNLIRPAEQQRMLIEWNATQSDYPAEFCIHQIFEAQVARTPEDCALIYRDQQLSYAELNGRANRLAQHIRTIGVRPGVLVGICMERSLDMLVAILAVLKAGAAYLPLDPAYPKDRLALMLEDAQAGLLLTQQRLKAKLPANQTALLCIDNDWPTISKASDENPHVAMSPLDLAYVIYTSGSTGKPKGVMVNHRNVVNFFTGMDQRIGGDTPGTWLAVTSISFDISVLELLWTLTRGFRVVIQPDKIHTPAPTAAPVPARTRPLDFSLFYFASDDQPAAGDTYRLLIEGAKFADRNGFTAVWTPERHFHQFGGLYPNPSVVGAALAMVTERVQIRAGSVVLPLQHPLRVAEEWAVVDQLSRGRVGISFASGWHADDFVLAPANFAERKEIMLRDIETVRRLWRGEALQFHGGTGQAVAVLTRPRPIQPELPVWITAAGNPETFRSAGEIGANLLTHLLGQSVEELRTKIASYREAWRAQGHPGEGHVTLMLHTFVAQDMEFVREQVRQPFTNYLRSSADLMRNLARSMGQDLQHISDADMDALLAHAFDRYFVTSGLFGTPEHCLQMVNQLQAIGVDEVACLIDFGVGTDTVLASLESLQQLHELSKRPEEETSSESPLQLLARHQVTHLQCTPSLARMLVNEPGAAEAFRSLRMLLLGGEALPGDLAAQLRAMVPGAIYNMYGPTETTIWSAVQRVEQDGNTIPIGTPIANTSIYILDRQLRPVPIGVPGELYIGGAGVVRGYLNRPELSAERFIPDPFAPAGQHSGSSRLYRTGDLARWRNDGTLEFLGRVDHQVKIGGHRIETGEIAAVLRQHAGVADAVVTAHSQQPGASYLAAYIVPAAGSTRALQPALDQAAQEQLLSGLRRYTLPNGMLIAHLSDYQSQMVYREVVEDDIYLRHGITLRPGDCLFDVGANIGMFTLFANQRCAGLKVYAFEPAPPTYAVLRANVALYGLDATVFPHGLSDRNETVEFTFYPEMAGLSGRYANNVEDRQATRAIMRGLHAERAGAQAEALTDQDIEAMLDHQFRSERYLCELRTLSDIIREQQITQIDLLKIDVEKAELDVLNGIADEDWGKIRQLAIEIDTPENLERITALLTAHGYWLAVDDFLVFAGQGDDPGVAVYMLYATRTPPDPSQSAGRSDHSAAVSLTAPELRRYLRERLPDYMVPSAYVFLEALPLTPNGKIDRRALQAPHEQQRELSSTYAPPQSAAEQIVAGIWQEVLRIERIGIHDNFFEVGGSSLLLVQVHTKLRAAFNRELAITDIFRHPTIAALAQFLGNPAPAADQPQIQERASKQSAARQQTEAVNRQQQFMQERRRKRQERG